MITLIYNFIGKILAKIMICTFFVIDCLFNLCFSREFKAPRFYYNKFIYLFAFMYGSLLYLPILLLRGKHPENVYPILEAFQYVAQKIMGMELTVRNSKVLAKDQAAVIVENHQSSLEILVYLQIWKTVKKLSGIGKKELLYVFPLGTVKWYFGTMYIDRKGGVKQLDKVGNEIVRIKSKALMHPEGTRNTKIGSMLPFKKGAFVMAIKFQVPIIPVVISPYYFIDYEAPSFGKPRIIMQVLDEVPTVGLTSEDVPKLMEKVQQQMWEQYEILYNEVMTKAKHEEDTNEITPGFVKLE